MASQQTLEGPSAPDPDEHRTFSREISNLEVWANSVPIRLAGYDDEPQEPHIFRGLD